MKTYRIIRYRDCQIYYYSGDGWELYEGFAIDYKSLKAAIIAGEVEGATHIMKMEGSKPHNRQEWSKKLNEIHHLAKIKRK